MRAVALLSIVAGAAGGCIGELEPAGGGPGATPEEVARTAFTYEVEPLLEGMCRRCHGGDDALGFVRAAPDVHATVMAWPGLVTLDAPGASRLLTRGRHAGPAWSSNQWTAIRGWIDLEVVARGGEAAGVATPIVDPVSGPASIPLDDLGLPGARVDLVVDEQPLGLYLLDLALVAGPDGAHVAHPLFVTWDGDTPRPDPLDSFEQVDLRVAPGGRAPIGAGLLILAGVPPTARLSLHFLVAAPRP